MIPRDLRYTSEHQWASRLETGRVAVGITDYAQKMLGDVVFIDLPKPGTKVVAGKPVCSVESVKAASDVFAPISGELIAVNEQLSLEPERLNSDPYGTLIFEIIPTDSEDFFRLMEADAYKVLTEENS